MGYNQVGQEKSSVAYAPIIPVYWTGYAVVGGVGFARMWCIYQTKYGNSYLLATFFAISKCQPAFSKQEHAPLSSIHIPVGVVVVSLEAWLSNVSVSLTTSHVCA